MSTSDYGSSSSGKSSREIEREAEANRAQLSETLEELRERLSPGQIVDELLSGSRANVTGFVENLGSSIRDNPMPALLIGAGLAMMMMGGATAASRSSSTEWDSNKYRRGMTRDDEERFGSDYQGRYSESRHSEGSHSSMMSKASEMASDAGEYASDLAHSARETASEYAHSASETAGSMVERVREGISSAAETVKEYIPGMGSSSSGSQRSTRAAYGERDYGRSYGQSRGMSRRGMMADVQDNLTRLAHEQPLLVAAVGMAIGAGLGAALPRTRMEDHYIGETAESLRDAATEAASEGYERAKEVVSRTADEIAEEARKQGLTPDKIGETARHAADDMTDRVKAVAERARSSVTEGAKDVAQATGLAGEAGPASAKPGEQRPGGTSSTTSPSSPGSSSSMPKNPGAPPGTGA